MEHELSSSPGPIDPSELSEVLKDGPRKKVVSLLSHAGNDGASFKEIVQETGLRPTTLAYHLKVLLAASLIKRGLKERTGRRDYSEYSLTERGSMMLRVIASMMERGADQKGPGSGPTELPGVLVTYMTIGPRCMVVTGWRR